MKLLIKKGAKDKVVAIFIGSGGSPIIGLTAKQLSCYRYRNDDGDNDAIQLQLHDGTKGTWSSGGFVEKDSDNMPGVYELGLDNAGLASGSDTVFYLLKGDGIAPVRVEIQLIDLLFVTRQPEKKISKKKMSKISKKMSKMSKISKKKMSKISKKMSRMSKKSRRMSGQTPDTKKRPKKSKGKKKPKMMKKKPKMSKGMMMKMMMMMMPSPSPSPKPSPSPSPKPSPSPSPKPSPSPSPKPSPFYFSNITVSDRWGFHYNDGDDYPAPGGGNPLYYSFQLYKYPYNGETWTLSVHIEVTNGGPPLSYVWDSSVTVPADGTVFSYFPDQPAWLHSSMGGFNILNGPGTIEFTWTKPYDFDNPVYQTGKITLNDVYD